MAEKKLDQTLIKELSSKDIAIVEKAISKLRKKKGVTYMTPVFDLLLEESDSEIQQLFSSYIYDNKDAGAVKL